MITVLGSINLDLVARVARLPTPGETVAGLTFATAPGGKGANQALAAARAGADVRLIGAVGDDAYAAEALSILVRGGVDLQRVRSVAGATGVALIMVDEAGENVIAVIAGANGAVASEDAAGLDFAPDDVLLLQLEVPTPSLEVAANRARAAGAAVVLNLAPFREDGLAIVPRATHLVVNEAECAAAAAAFGMTGSSISEQAEAFARRQGTTVIVTLGREGALSATESGSERVPALPVTPVDTVGAGDTFCGYLAAGLSEGLALDEALLLASAAGSIACTRPGAQPAIPHRDEVEAAIRTR